MNTLDPRRCKGCNRYFTPASNRHCRQTYCNEACRVETERKRRQSEVKAIVHARRCHKCGKRFEAIGRERRTYCSTTCRKTVRKCQERPRLRVRNQDEADPAELDPKRPERMAYYMERAALRLPLFG